MKSKDLMDSELYKLTMLEVEASLMKKKTEKIKEKIYAEEIFTKEKLLKEGLEDEVRKRVKINRFKNRALDYVEKLLEDK